MVYFVVQGTNHSLHVGVDMLAFQVQEVGKKNLSVNNGGRPTEQDEDDQQDEENPGA